MKNSGKIFEEDFTKSLKPTTMCYRLRDSATSFNLAEEQTRLEVMKDAFKTAKIPPNKFNVFMKYYLEGMKNTIRFTPSNICDFIIFNGQTLFLAELKSHKGISLPKNCIRNSQLVGLYKYRNYKHVTPCFIINLRHTTSKIDENLTFFIRAEKVYKEFFNENTKSISLQFLKENGNKIKSVKKIKRYRYILHNL